MHCMRHEKGSQLPPLELDELDDELEPPLELLADEDEAPELDDELDEALDDEL